MRSIPWMMSMFGLIFMLCPISGLCGSIPEPKQASQQDTVDKDLEKQQEMEKLLAIVKKRSQPVQDANFNLTISAHPSIGEVAESQQVKVVKRIDGSQPYSVFEKEIHALLEMI